MGGRGIAIAQNATQKTKSREQGTFQEPHQERPNRLYSKVFYGPVPYVPYF